MGQTHSPHPAMAGAHPAGTHVPAGTDPNKALNPNQVMLPQLQTSHTGNQDLGQSTDSVTPLTPQDQLSSFVDRL